MTTSRPHTPGRIAADLVRLGVTPGSIVMIHASLRAIGPARGGADGVLDAVFHTIGVEGTVMMVLGAADDHAWVNDRPEHTRAELLTDAEPFDATVTPADPDVGTLAEVFRTRPGTVVSDHPEGRFAASGARAHELVRDVPWNDYFGPGSPLARLVAWGGSVLRMGADADTTTVIHHAEYLADIPEKRRVLRHRLVATPSGPMVRVVECLDDADGIVDHPGEDYFSIILRTYLSTVSGSRGIVGSAESELLDAAEFVAFATEWITSNLG